MFIKSPNLMFLALMKMATPILCFIFICETVPRSLTDLFFYPNGFNLGVILINFNVTVRGLHQHFHISVT